MKCPIDDTELAMTDRQGIEVDYCPKCRGVWLDRGELDKIIERSTDDEVTSPRHADRPRYSEDSNFRDNRKDSSHRPHKKKSLLGEIFDF